MAPALAAGLGLAAAAAAWRLRFVQDDAFVSMRYARNLVAGHGLVFNPGEPAVEGYTNFLWTLLLALPEAGGLDPVRFVFLLGPVFAAGTLWLTFVLARRLGAPPLHALGGVALLASQPSFLAFCTGGLETGLLTTFVVGCAALACGPLGTGTLGLLSLLTAAAVMCRPDAVLLVGFACLAAGLALEQRPRRVAALLIPGTLPIAAWIVFKLAAYGTLVPNTFVAKTGGEGAWEAGTAYLLEFARSTWLIAAPLAWLLVAPRWLGDRTHRLRLLLVVVLPVVAFAVYVAAVGGDFIEFRLLVPTFPLIFAGTAAVLRRPLAPVWLPGILAVVLAAGSVHHATRFRSTDFGLESVGDLAAHLSAPDQDWIGVGRRLGQLFGHEPVRIAVSAAGAIPYYSGLPTLDMVGLNDAWVARHGIEISGQPGHARAAPFAWLVEQDVHLVLGHPWVITPTTPPDLQPLARGIKGFRFLVDVDRTRIRRARMLAIPLGDDRHLIALSLTPHPAVERAAEAGGWPVLDLSRIGGRQPQP